MCVSIWYIYTYIHTYVIIYIYTYIHTCVYTFICIYVLLLIQKRVDDAFAKLLPNLIHNVMRSFVVLQINIDKSNHI